MIPCKKWINSNNSSQKAKRKLFQNENYFKSCPMHTVKFPTEDGKLQKWLQENYAEISQKVNIFVKMCHYHTEKKPLTGRVAEKIISNNGPCFRSDNFHSFCDQLDNVTSNPYIIKATVTQKWQLLLSHRF